MSLFHSFTQFNSLFNNKRLLFQRTVKGQFPLHISSKRINMTLRSALELMSDSQLVV